MKRSAQRLRYARRQAAFALFLSLAACAPSHEIPAGYPQPGQGELSVAVAWVKPRVQLGELAKLRASFRLAAGQGAALEQRELSAGWKEACKKLRVQLVPSKPLRMLQDDGSVLIIAELGLRPFQLGKLEFSPLVVHVKNGSGKSLEAKSELPVLEVLASLAQDASQDAEIEADLVADPPPAALWPWLVAGALLALLVYAVHRFRRRRRKDLALPLVPRITPLEQALGRLRELERMLERAEIGAERLVVESSATLRRWLEDGLGQQTLARTTEEFLADLRGSQRFSTQLQNRLQDFLRRCDLIKFAKQQAGLSECQELLRSVRDFIEATSTASAETSEPGAKAGLASCGLFLFQAAATQAAATPSAATPSAALQADGVATGQTLFEWQEEMFGFAFADPFFLLLLLLLPVFAWWLHRRRKPALGFASLRLFEGLPRSARMRWSFVPRLLVMLGLVPLILAVARPQSFERLPVDTQGIDILLSVDLSSSMAAQDLGSSAARGKQNSRLAVVKRVAKAFIDGRADDRIGLVAFARYPDLICPSTLDHAALLRFLAPLQHKRLPMYRGDQGDPEDGTAIGAALALSVKRLKGMKSKSRVVILLSDGEETVHEIEPLDAAKLAKDAGIRVYTIGAGRGVRGPFGGIRRPDFASLRSISKISEGAFFEADSEAALEAVFAKIDKLERSTIEDPIFSVDERFHVFLLLGFGLLALAAMLRLLFFVRVP